MRTKAIARGTAVMAVAAVLCAAAPRGQAQSPMPGLAVETAETRTLPNGLTVILAETQGGNVFSGTTACLAGYAFDPAGASGTAHLLEHVLAFRTQALTGPPRELIRELTAEYEKTGGADSPRTKALEAQISGMRKRGEWSIGTTADLVSYGIMDYPSEQLERFLMAGAETLKEAPDSLPDVERERLARELRVTVAGDLRGQLASHNLTTALPGHPYGAPVGGRVSDVQAITLEALRAFHLARYEPGRCVVVAAGDLRAATFFHLVDKHFGGIPRRPVVRGERPVAPRFERRATVASPAGPRVVVSFVKPPLPSEDDAVAAVVASILFTGKAGRLYSELVERSKLARTVGAGNGGPGQHFDNLLTLEGVPAPATGIEELEAALLHQLERLKTEPVGDAELKEAVARLVEADAGRYPGAFDLAFAIARHQLAAGDWRVMLEGPDKWRRIMPRDIMGFARKYFVPDNRSVLTLLPEPKPQGPSPARDVGACLPGR